jgi:tricorn protease-like protein
MQPLIIEMINGNTPFACTMSADGKQLAFHNKVGEIQIIDTANGKTIQTIVADIEMIEEMAFADNNNLLLVQEQYGTWGMRYFDLSSNKEIKIDGLKLPEYTQQVRNFCFNADLSKLVLVQRATAHVFDFNEKKLLHSFEIEHTVKTCAIKFIGDKLGVRTDYGCFSIYNV